MTTPINNKGISLPTTRVAASSAPTPAAAPSVAQASAPAAGIKGDSLVKTASVQGSAPVGGSDKAIDINNRHWASAGNFAANFAASFAAGSQKA